MGETRGENEGAGDTNTPSTSLRSRMDKQRRRSKLPSDEAAASSASHESIDLAVAVEYSSSVRELVLNGFGLFGFSLFVVANSRGDLCANDPRRH